jgi:peptide/nickel transport system permease protein
MTLVDRSLKSLAVAADGLPTARLGMFRRRRKASKLITRLAVGWLCLVVGVAMFADALPLPRYDVIDTSVPARTAPFTDWRVPLGTDGFGRSVLARLIFGARESLLVGICATMAALILGVMVGLVAGYLQGWVDHVVGVVLDAVLAVPPLILLLAIASVGQRGIVPLIVGLGIVGTPSFARLARVSTLALASQTFVTAARALGASPLRIVVRELAPAVMLRVSPLAFLFTAYVMVAEGSLSFLGLGVPPPAPSWGAMINDGRASLDTQPWLVFVPAVCLILTVGAFTALGDQARARLDSSTS